MRVTNYQPQYSSTNLQNYHNSSAKAQSFGKLSVNPLILVEDNPVMNTHAVLGKFKTLKSFKTAITAVTENLKLSKKMEKAIKHSPALKALGEKYDVLASVVRRPDSIVMMENVRWFDRLVLEISPKAKGLEGAKPISYEIAPKLEVGLKDGVPIVYPLSTADYSKSKDEIFKIIYTKGLTKSKENNFYEGVLKDAITNLKQDEIEKVIPKSYS